MLEEKEFGELIDTCWARFPLDGRWSKALAVVQDLSVGGTVLSQPLLSSQDVNHDYIAAIRVKMLKKLFMMLSREEKATWMDRVNAKYPSESYKKKIQDLKDTATAALNKPPDLSDPAAHIPRMKADLKIRWLEAIVECIMTETENSARLAALKQALQPFANGKMPPPPTPQQQEKPTLVSVEKLLDQLSDADRAVLLAKLITPPIDKIPERQVVDRATSPSPELEQTSEQMPANSEIEKALKELLDRYSESQVLVILHNALEDENTTVKNVGVENVTVENVIVDGLDTTGPGTVKDEQPEQAQAPSLSGRLKRRLTAVNAVAEPMEWQRSAVLTLDAKPALNSIWRCLILSVRWKFLATASVRRESSLVPSPPNKVVPLMLNALLGKHAMGTSGAGGATGNGHLEMILWLNAHGYKRKFRYAFKLATSN